MYNTPKILKDLREIRSTIDKAIKDVQESEKSLKRFYKKGFKLTARKTRKNLLIVINDLKELRSDIQRLKKEREVFEGTELEDDFNG